MRKFAPWLLLLLVFALWNCSDDLTRDKYQSDVPRIELSLCQYCNKCVDPAVFTCPQHAIKADTLALTYVIDKSKCVRCLRCVDQLHCPGLAFTTVPDTIPPATPNNLTASQLGAGMLQINFTSIGDDGDWGRAKAYHLQLLDADGQPIPTAFTPEAPVEAGQPQFWFIDDLPTGTAAPITVRLTVEDEAGNTCPAAVAITTALKRNK